VAALLAAVRDRTATTTHRTGPTGIGRALGLLRAGDDWVAAGPPSGGRLGRVLVPATVARARTLVGLAGPTPTPPGATARGILPRGLPALRLWADQAHPRQAVPSAVGGDRLGLLPEVAYAVIGRAELVVTVVVVPLPDRDLAVAGTDPLAVDLVVLALADPVDAPDALGPWQHPAVQRAAELGHGVPGPHALHLEVEPQGWPADPAALVAHVRARLGLPET
jgi:hypothetical protein